MQAIVSGDAEAFYEREIAERERAGLPPFGRLAGIIVSAATRAEAESHARGLRRAAPPSPDIQVLGPAEAPLALIARPPSLPPAGAGERRADMQGYHPGNARRRPEDPRLGPGAGRHRPAELSVAMRSGAPRLCLRKSEGCVWRGAARRH